MDNYLILSLVRNVKTLKLLALLHNFYYSECYVFHERRKKPQVILFWQRDTVRCTLVRGERKLSMEIHFINCLNSSCLWCRHQLTNHAWVYGWKEEDSMAVYLNPETWLSLRQHFHDPLSLRNWARGFVLFLKLLAAEKKIAACYVCVCVCV